MANYSKTALLLVKIKKIGHRFSQSVPPAPAAQSTL
jgi:hypothetical protein